MSYTVGVKRRFLPGYKKYAVTRHSWENFRFLIDLASGDQLVIPGFRADGIRVYADIKEHIQKIEAQTRLYEFEERERNQRLVAERQVIPQRAPVYPQTTQTVSHPQEAQDQFNYLRQGAAVQQTQETYAPPQPYQNPGPNAQEIEARRRANEHLQGIFGGDGQAAGRQDRPPLS